MPNKIESKTYEAPRMGLFLLQFLIALLFVVFCARYWYLQIHRGEEFARLALENKTKIASVFTPLHYGLKLLFYQNLSGNKGRGVALNFRMCRDQDGEPCYCLVPPPCYCSS